MQHSPRLRRTVFDQALAVAFYLESVWCEDGDSSSHILALRVTSSGTNISRGDSVTTHAYIRGRYPPNRGGSAVPSTSPGHWRAHLNHDMNPIEDVKWACREAGRSPLRE